MNVAFTTADPHDTAPAVTTAFGLLKSGFGVTLMLWSRCAVQLILKNEKYIGTYVFGRMAFRLKQRRVPRPEQEWVRRENSHAALVSQALFDRAQQRFAGRPQPVENAGAPALGGLALCAASVFGERRLRPAAFPPKRPPLPRHPPPTPPP